jgi:hypothetical protein
MKIYQVPITIESYGWYDVEAEDLEQAKILATAHNRINIRPDELRGRENSAKIHFDEIREIGDVGEGLDLDAFVYDKDVDIATGQATRPCTGPGCSGLQSAMYLLGRHGVWWCCGRCGREEQT